MDLNIYISCHKPSFVPNCDVFKPIQVGTELSTKRFPDMYHDNEGINISEKNKTYCELTAQYWAWKNVKADYYGFFHYRRYFSFEKKYDVDSEGKIREKYPKPYRDIMDIKSDSLWCEYDKKKIENLVEKYDVISIIREHSNFNAYDQYCQFHIKKDLDIMLDILNNMYPEYEKAATTYMNSKELYFMNMYIMSKTHFNKYMAWLFPLLEKFEDKVDHSEYSESERRAPAYLAERLFGIYYTFQKIQTDTRCCELPYMVYRNTEPYQKVDPVYTKNSVPIVLSSDRKFVPYLAVMLQSIIKCSTIKHNYDILILHKNIEQELQIPVIDMVREFENISVRFYDCASLVNKIPFKVHHHFSEETFYRYFILDIMKDYSKVMYLDVDMVVMRDVAELFDEHIDGYWLAAVKDMDVIGTYKSDEVFRTYVDKNLELKKPLEYFQAGVLLINLIELRKELSSAQMVQLTLKREWKMVDQDVLNILCQGKVKFLPQKWNVLINWRNSERSRMDVMKQTPYSLFEEYLEARKQPFIIHYAGGWKPWNTPRCDYSKAFWEYARQTEFYEEMLCENMSKLAYGHAILSNSSKRVFKLKPTTLEIAIDMKKIDRILPAGSRRRSVVKTIFKKFL